MDPQVLERIVYALFALFAFKEIVGVFRKDMRATMNDALAGLGAQWDRDRDEMKSRQAMLYEQVVLKTEQLEDALTTLAQLSKTPLKKARARPKAFDPNDNDPAAHLMNGLSRADMLNAPEKHIP